MQEMRILWRLLQLRLPVLRATAIGWRGCKYRDPADNDMFTEADSS